MSSSKYVKCPRCELNYILSTEEVCDVCKVEMGLVASPVDSSMEEDDFTRELCPICKRNFINYDEEMCESCANEKLKESEESDEEWRSYLDDETEIPEDELIITLGELAEEELVDEEEEEEEEESYDYSYEDDFEDVDIEDFEETELDEDEDEDDE